MAYHQTFWPVAPSLSPLVDHIWVMRCDEARLEAAAGALLPQFIWQIDGRLGWVSPGGSEFECYPATLLGSNAGALRLTSEGNNIAVGVGIFPEGWFRFIDFNASELISQGLDLRRIWGEEALSPLSAPPGASDEQLVDLVHKLLIERLSQAPPLDPRVEIISRWINGPAQDIDVLTAELGITQRQLARVAQRAHGLPPRLLANRHRVLKAAAMIAANLIGVREAWTEDFADQSHFIREFRRFMGITPAAFLREKGWLVREVMRVRMEIASEHPLGLNASFAAKPAVRIENVAAWNAPRPVGRFTRIDQGEHRAGR
jgi:AraC-like DNA-binding protein